MKGATFGRRFIKEVRGPHPHLERGERVLGSLATLAHRLWVLIETTLYGFDHVLVCAPRRGDVRTILLGRAHAFF
jgi:hypothetical protein